MGGAVKIIDGEEEIRIEDKVIAWGKHYKK
jgi:hypothetical protein